MGAHLDISEYLGFGARVVAASAVIEAGGAQALARTAYAIQGTAQLLAPVDTGALVNSISVAIDGMSAEIGPTVEYGIWQELGTSRMQGQPYMGPAFDREVPGFVSALGQIAEQAI